MTSGVVLLAIGPKNYQRFALNLAVSIRYYSGDVPIQLIYDDLSELSEVTHLFDVLTPIDQQDCRINGKLAPGLAKTSLYKYLAFDRTLYLDVDAVCIKDIKPLLKKDRKGYEAEVQGWGTLETFDYGIAMQWANGPTIAEKYGLPLNTKLPFLNSSAQIIDKCDIAEKVFQQARENMLNPIPAKELHKGWGKKQAHRQPDELYTNIALAQLGYDPTCGDSIVYFHLRNNAQPCELGSITKGYYFLGCYGAVGTNHRRIYSFYDNIMSNAMRDVLGCNHVFKVHDLMTQKFMVYEPVN